MNKGKKNLLPIYIKSLQIKNIRTFGSGEEKDGFTLELGKKDGTIPKWTLILGDNGIGKSTLLQSIAWLKPNIHAAKNNETKNPEPIINDEENEKLERLVRGQIGKKISGKLEAIFIANERLDEKSTSNGAQCKNSFEISLNEKKKLEDIILNFETDENGKDIFGENEVLIYAYSASRHLGKLNVLDDSLIDTIPNFIKDKTELYDAEEILHKIKYASLDTNKNEEKKYLKYKEKIFDMLVSVLPDFNNVEDIEVSAPKLFNKDLKGGVLITTRHGEKIPFEDYSLGIKSIISLTVDLAWRFFLKCQEDKDKVNYPKNPLNLPAIVLIDEIDLHLHPIWQREIMANLSKHFPNVQFIATAHTPLMVQANLGSNHAVLKYNEKSKEVEIINDPQGIDGWRIDQILTSEFFGLKSSRGIEYEKLLKKREELIYKETLDKKEEAKLKKITKQLSNLPSGETPEEIENRKLISEIVAKIKK